MIKTQKFFCLLFRLHFIEFNSFDISTLSSVYLNNIFNYIEVQKLFPFVCNGLLSILTVKVWHEHSTQIHFFNYYLICIIMVHTILLYNVLFFSYQCDRDNLRLH